LLSSIHHPTRQPSNQNGVSKIQNGGYFFKHGGEGFKYGLTAFLK